MHVSAVQIASPLPPTSRPQLCDRGGTGHHRADGTRWWPARACSRCRAASPPPGAFLHPCPRSLRATEPWRQGGDQSTSQEVWRAFRSACRRTPGTASAHGRRERAPMDWKLLRDHVNVQRPGKHQVNEGMWASGETGRRSPPQSAARATRSRDRAQPQGGPPAESRNPICPLHCPHPHGAQRRERVDRPGDGGLCRPVYRVLSLRLRGGRSVR